MSKTDLQKQVDFEKRRKAFEEGIEALIKEHQLVMRPELDFTKTGIVAKIAVYDTKKYDEAITEEKPTPVAKKGKK